jgi:hypothetical protein
LRSAPSLRTDIVPGIVGRLATFEGSHQGRPLPFEKLHLSFHAVTFEVLHCHRFWAELGRFSLVYPREWHVALGLFDRLDVRTNLAGLGWEGDLAAMRRGRTDQLAE